MLGIVLIYVIGRAFFDLADSHNKNKWGFAVAGVVSYYAGTFLTGILVGIALLAEIIDEVTLNNANDFALNLIALPFGLLVCWGFYHLLKRHWSKKKISKDSTILDANVFD